MRVLVVDNYDSFVYNLVHYLAQLGAEPVVRRNDAVRPADLDAAVTGWVLGLRVDGVVLDVAFPAARVAIEVDGWAWHSGVDRFRRDRQRQNALVLAGWTVLRFTWHDLTVEPERVVREVRAALAARR